MTHWTVTKLVASNVALSLYVSSYQLGRFGCFQGRDMNELKRHIYSNTVDRSAVKKLLREVFLPCRCREAHQKQQRQVTRKCNFLSRLDNNKTNLLLC